MRSHRFFFAVIAVTLAGFGCAHVAVVTDRADSKTPVTRARLEDENAFKILLGGAVRSIPITDIKVIKIDPSNAIVFERGYYYSAQVILRDGTILSQSGQEVSSQSQCYINILNTLVGKHKGEVYRIPLENVVQIKYDR